MSNAENNHRIDYLEFGAIDIARTKEFYAQAFGWEFTDYGPGYTSFHDGCLAGGFRTDIAPGRNPLVVLYAASLEDIIPLLSRPRSSWRPLKKPRPSPRSLPSISFIRTW